MVTEAAKRLVAVAIRPRRARPTRLVMLFVLMLCKEQFRCYSANFPKSAAALKATGIKRAGHLALLDTLEFFFRDIKSLLFGLGSAGASPAVSCASRDTFPGNPADENVRILCRSPVAGNEVRRALDRTAPVPNENKTSNCGKSGLLSCTVNRRALIRALPNPVAREWRELPPLPPGAPRPPSQLRRSPHRLRLPYGH